jgi:hypothetical protein
MRSSTGAFASRQAAVALGLMFSRLELFSPDTRSVVGEELPPVFFLVGLSRSGGGFKLFDNRLARVQVDLRPDAVAVTYWPCAQGTSQQGSSHE